MDEQKPRPWHARRDVQWFYSVDHPGDPIMVAGPVELVEDDR